MSRLFISGSKSPGTLRPLLLTLGISTLLLFLLDQSAAPIMIRLFGPPANLFGEDHNLPGVETLWQIQDTGLHPIVFTGSSEMQLGISPHLFDNQMQALTGVSTLSVNVSFVGASPIITRDVMKSLILPAKPPVVIYGIEMRALHETARQWITLLANAPMGFALSLQPGIEQETIFWLGRHSAFFRYRDNVRNWLNGGATGNAVLVSDDRGFIEVQGQGNFVAATGIFRGQVTPFQTDDDMRRAFDEIGSLCRQSEIKCIVVNMPLHRLAYNYFTPADESAYRKLLLSMTMDNKLPLWDFDTAICRSYLGDESFYDLNHLNGVGATKLTQAMANLYARQVAGKTLLQESAEVCAEVILP